MVILQAERISGKFAFLFSAKAEVNPPIKADVLHFSESIVAPRWRVGDTVFAAGEIEEIGIAADLPIAPTSEFERQVTAVLIANAGGFGEGVAEGIIEIRGVVAIKSHEGDATYWVETTAGDGAEAPVGILGGGEFAEGIEPAVVITGRGAENGLVAATEIMLIIGGIGIRMDAIRPEIFDGRQFDLKLFMAEREIGSEEMMPDGVIGATHGV